MSRGPRKAPSLLEQVRSFKQYVVETLNGFSPDMREMILAEINESMALGEIIPTGEEKGEARGAKQKRTRKVAAAEENLDEKFPKVYRKKNGEAAAAAEPAAEA